MKAFWDDLFFDKENSKWSDEQFADEAGKVIRSDLDDIENAIRDHNGKRALALIAEFKRDY